MDLNFSKGKVTSDFKEADTLENIKSGESISTIFGKVQRWYPEIESCITEDDLNNALKDLPERYYNVDGTKGGIILTPEDENNVASRRGSVVSGVSSRATGPSSIAMGSNCIAIGEGSVSMGMHNQTSNACDFAVGSDNKTMGGHSSAIGISNKTFGRASIAMGEDNQATRLQSVAIGKFNLSSADNSVAIGCGLVADSKYQTVIGRYNIRESDGKYAFIIGNGTSDEASHQSNALTLDWDGNLWTAGDVTATDSDGNNVSLCETALAVSNLQNVNAPTATKLQTARQINGTDFDGSEDITIPIKGCYAYDESTTASTAPWHKAASCTLTKGSEDAYAVFHVYRTLASTFPGGILKVRIRTNTDVTLQSCNLLWEYANNINKEDFILCIIQDQNSKTLTAELWVSITARWIGYQFTMIADTDRTSIRSGRWTLYNSSIGQAAYTESYKTITSEFSPIQNTAELSDSGWIRMTISGGNGELYYRKCGKTVELKGSASPNVDNEWTVCTLPDGYRPSTASVDVIVMGNSPRRLSISTQGVVTVSNVTAHEAISLHACFLVD